MRTLLFLALATPFAFSADQPDPAVITAAMKKAVTYVHTHLAREGGYASSWDKEGKIGEVEHAKSPTIISIQPHGTTTMGLAILKAYQATGDEVFLTAAKDAAKSLIKCQLASGGWDSDFDFDPEKIKKYYLRSDLDAGDKEPGKRRNSTTLDDNKTQSAMLFLLEMAHEPACKDDVELKHCLKFAFDALLAAQAPIGAWPQQFSGPADPKAPVLKASYPETWSRTFPAVKYSGFYTLNDDNLQQVAKVLFRAYELEKDERYLASLKKLGEFFLLAQMPEPQPVWAQQYDFDMHPVWARKFEPPSVTGYESLGAMEVLHQLWVLTGDDKYLKPIQPALAWFDRSKLPDGTHARFYELQTNKPLFFVKDTYELTYDSSNIPTHYSFTDMVQDNIDDFKKKLAKSREELQHDQAGPQTPKEWLSRAKGAASKARKAAESLDSEGRWLKNDQIDAGEFVKNMNAMTNYVEARKKSGE
ncbi:pectate lyase [Prosthecobacter vanneervenii]|uniref:PelA/Pel-15E family pectate lyase n=1 Tax=Prosthecobacter vanneervenii TaxID=48466 RepID=A0A7W8DK43_9BACT|nr:pectate lyase [Prosthecobacter vanneervenii]MBB5032839.1 PelA/Pel-15E family pectate lyase [Prosthecobacter vanneervenii]